MSDKEEIKEYNETTECNWIKNVPYTPINEYEKEMLKTSKTAEQLLEEEAKEKTMEQNTEELQQIKKNYINKIKIIALSNLALYPLSNPSTFPTLLKNKVINEMKNLIEYYNVDEELLTNDFNNVCLEKIFTQDIDYSTFPVYK